MMAFVREAARGACGRPDGSAMLDKMLREGSRKIVKIKTEPKRPCVRCREAIGRRDCVLEAGSARRQGWMIMKQLGSSIRDFIGVASGAIDIGR